jgi:hypothetical protein
LKSNIPKPEGGWTQLLFLFPRAIRMSSNWARLNSECFFDWLCNQASNNSLVRNEQIDLHVNKFKSINNLILRT